jgi:hypothetical protein
VHQIICPTHNFKKRGTAGKCRQSGNYQFFRGNGRTVAGNRTGGESNGKSGEGNSATVAAPGISVAGNVNSVDSDARLRGSSFYYG